MRCVEQQHGKQTWCKCTRLVSVSPDPVLWSADQVIHWAVWVMKEFNIDEMEIGSIHIPGRELCAFSQEEFLQKVPNGEILWSHLELLRKCEPDACFKSQTSGRCQI